MSCLYSADQESQNPQTLGLHCEDFNIFKPQNATFNIYPCQNFRAQLFGWQDTYVFSKALGEMLLNAQREDIPMVVLRPSVVESTLAEPFPGWMEGIRYVIL